jgi:hypothetical protein
LRPGFGVGAGVTFCIGFDAGLGVTFFGLNPRER